MTNDDLPDFIVAVERNDYAELYDHVYAIGGPDQAATVRDYQDQVAICAFCGETADLEPYLHQRVEIPHARDCRQPLIATLLQRLPKPMER
jgi:hypothetical protein